MRTVLILIVLCAVALAHERSAIEEYFQSRNVTEGEMLDYMKKNDIVSDCYQNMCCCVQSSFGEECGASGGCQACCIITSANPQPCCYMEMYCTYCSCIGTGGCG